MTHTQIEFIVQALRAAHPFERQRNDRPAESRAKQVQHRIQCNVFAFDIEQECSKTGAPFDRAAFMASCGY